MRMSWIIWDINSLWPSNAIWQQRSGSTLAQVMAWCLKAPSHYLNQCWLIISDIHLRASSQEMLQRSITEIIWKIKYLKFHSNFPGANKLKQNHMNHMVVEYFQCSRGIQHGNHYPARGVVSMLGRQVKVTGKIFNYTCGFVFIPRWCPQIYQSRHITRLN